VCVVSVILLIADCVGVVTGVFQASDSQAWTWYATMLGHQAYRALEAVTLAGVVAHSRQALALVAVAAMLVTTAILLMRKHLFTAALLLVLMTGCLAVMQTMKLAINRSGPPLTQWTPMGHTFPSGTTSMGIVYFGFLALILGMRNRGIVRSASIALSVVACVALIASALTYHYPSEVIGGILMGLAWLALIVLIFMEPLTEELSEPLLTTAR